MRNYFGGKAWVAYLAGLTSLLALLFLPGITALRRTERVFNETLQLQRQHEETERALRDVETEMYLVSIRVREFLLDNSGDADLTARESMRASRRRLNRALDRLRHGAPGITAHPALQALEDQLSSWWQAIEPAFSWTPDERAAKATWFLREQQRPRRENLLAMADELERLADSAYQQQYSGLRETEQAFRRDIERVMAVAFVIGVAIALVTVVRVQRLEWRAEEHQRAAERLSSQLMHAQEEERQNVARELHDEVGQILTALRMDIGVLDRLRASPQFDERLAESKNLAERALRSVRNLAVVLRPSVLDLGLVPALHSQAREIGRRFDLMVHVEAEGNLEELPEASRTCLYRIAQESLTNVVKHANARQVTVRVRESKDSVELEVQDDGQGFDPGRERSGLGLPGMRERLRILGGSLTVTSQPSHGTRVHAVLPLRDAREGAA